MRTKIENHFKARLLLTGKCTAKCGYCHNEGQSKHAKLLKLEYIKEVFEKLEFEKKLPEEVVLSGGEPTLNKQAMDIAKFLKSKNIYVSMTSHIGHTDLLEPILPYLDELKIHLDSFKRHEQMKSMGIPLENVINSINLAKKHPLKLIINHPLINKEETIDFIESARKINIDCKLIEEFKNPKNIELNSIDWEKLGYLKDKKNRLKHKDSDHRIYLKRCGYSNNNDKTLFIGSEGLRTALDKENITDKVIALI